MTYQLGPGLMDALVLAIIEHEDIYGYAISQEIKKVISLKESTLYPVLKRLQAAGYLQTYDQPYQGRNRRYYHITGEGKQHHGFTVEEWISFRDSVEDILLRKEREGNEETAVSGAIEEEFKESAAEGNR